MVDRRYSPTTALVIVDVQNDFADPKGALSVTGGPAVVNAVNVEIAAATEAGTFVVYSQDWHPPVTPHFIDSGGVWPVHCVRETWGAEFHPDLVIAGPSVRKGTGGEDGYSAFTIRDPLSDESSSTGLDELLKNNGVERVVVVGLALDYCVKATALDAVGLGYDTVVPLGATAAVELAAGDGMRAAKALTEAGVKVVG